jgi:glycosyltransferase involved in cell wall biosynthesis
MTLSTQRSNGEEPAAIRMLRVRLAYLVSHPIQYQVPLLRRIAREPEIDLTVLFGSDFSVTGYKDEGFGVAVKWDLPLLGGYRHEFLPVLRDKRTEGTFTPISRRLMRQLVDPEGNPKYDLLWVHGYATVNQMYGILAANALGIPVLLRSDATLGDRSRSAFKLWLKELFFAAFRHMIEGVLAVGTRNREYWEHYLGAEFPIYSVPYSVDNAFFQSACRAARSSRAELQTELEISSDRPVILFASKLQPRKHCDDLIAAYAMLSDARAGEPVPYLVIVGDGEERAALERQAAATGFTSIRFCGFRNQSQLPRFLDLCTVFVLPSRHEPWGLIVNEAMNAGRAVIVSDDVGCQPDLVTDGVEGCVYPVRDVKALAGALRRVLATPETAAEMGRLALERISHWGFEEDIEGLHQAVAGVTRKLRGRRPNAAGEPGTTAPGPGFVR